MNAQSGTVFPAYIRAEYDGSTSAFAQFEGAVDRAFGRASSRLQRFNTEAADVGAAVKRALASGDGLTLGRVDVGVDQLRQVAAQARLTEAAVSQMYSSARALAVSTGDTTDATRLYLAELGAKVTEARDDVAATTAQVTTYERLQVALDATADRNNRLAQSYREVFSEQARMARQEVYAREYQKGVEEVFSPALNRRATDNGAGYGALAEQAERYQQTVQRLNAELRTLEQQFERNAAAEAAVAERAAAAQRAHAAALDELRRAEAGAAEGSRLLHAIHQGTGLQIDRTSKSARDSAAVFEMYERQLNELRAQVDPLFFAQQRLTQQTELLDLAVRQGMVTDQQRAVLLQRLGAQFAMNAESTRAQRFAYVQLGQQLQDVTIQAQMGVNPFIILTQQGSQAAYAMSGLGGSVGRVATFLSGPWGAAILGATTALGLFVASLKDGESASKGMELASDGLAASQSVLGEMFDLVSGKLKNQNDLLRLNAQLQAVNLRAEASASRDRADSFKRSVGPSAFTSFTAGGLGEGGDISVSREARNAQTKLRNLLTQVAGGTLDASDAFSAVTENDVRLLNSSLTEYRNALVDAASARAKEATAAAINLSLDQNVLAESLRKPDTSKPKKDRSAEKAAREAKRLADFYDKAEERIARINERFDEQPRLVDRTAAATRELDAIIKDLSERKPPGFEKLITQAKAAKDVVREALVRPYDEFLDKAREQEALDRLILKGREDQAIALQRALSLAERMGSVTREQVQGVLETVQAERERGKELDKLRDKQDAYLSALNGVRGALSGGIAGVLTGRGGNFGEAIGDQLANLFATRLTDRLFGGMFSYLEDQITGGANDVRDAGDYLVKVLTDLGHEIRDVQDLIAGRAAGTSVLGDAANDNAAGVDDAIPVIGRRLQNVDPITSLGNTLTRVFDKEFEQLGKIFKGSGDAAGIGVLSGQLFNGSSNNKLVSAIGGALGAKAGEALGQAVGGPVGAEIGKIAGSVLGGLVGGLFAGPAPSASSVVTSVGGAAQVTGNNTEQQQAVTGVSVNLQSTLQRIIDQLGGSAGAFDVSIGKREDYYRVAGVNTTAVGDKHPERGTGITLLYNGQDANEALRIAVLEAFRDGAVQGVREGTKRLLTGNSDIEIGVAKATKFEQVFRDLKRYTDPAGAALDALNQKFRQLKTIFDEAGASAQDYADLEDLYGRERADALKQVTDQLTSGLKSFLSSLTTGDSGLSLRTRQANALAEYNPLAARVQAGDQSAYDAYVGAAQTLLDIQRQIYGSGEEYFATLDQVIAMTKGAILTEESKLNAANDSGSPFDTKPLISATEKQTSALVDALAPRLDSIAASNAAIADAVRNSTYALTRADYYAGLGQAANW